MNKYLSKQIPYIVLDQIIISGLNFCMAIYMARTLGLSVFGQYSIILIITMFCLEIQRSIIISPMMVFYPYYDKAAYLKSVSGLQNILTLTLMVICGFILYTSHYFSPKWQVNLYTAPGVLFLGTRLQHEYLRKKSILVGKSKAVLQANTVFLIIMTLSVVILHHYNEFALKNILYAFSLSYSISSLLLYWVTLDRNGIIDRAYIVFSHWKFGKWLLLSSANTYLSSDILILMGSSALGSQASGTIKTCQYIMGGMMIIFQSMESIIPPRLSLFIKKNNKRGLRKGFIQILLSVAGVTILHGIIVFMFMDQILKWIYSGDYSEAQHNIAISYIFFSIILSCNYCMSYLIKAFKGTRIIFYTSFITAITVLTSGHLFIKHYALYGIMISLFLTQIIIFIIYSFKCAKVLNE